MEKKVNVLIVDDHQIVIDGIISVLTPHPCISVVATAINGEGAWSVIQSLHDEIDLVITDINMSGINGIELCHKIKESYCNIKVLFLTMHDDVLFVKQAIECEADGYMLKNCNKNELLKAIEAVIEKGSYFTYNIIKLLYAQDQTGKDVSENKLTARETEILGLILQEMTSREIAEKLFISKQTVDSHRIRIMEKTSSKSIVGLMKYAMRHKLIS